MSDATPNTALHNLHQRATDFAEELRHWQTWAEQSGSVSLVQSVTELSQLITQIGTASQPQGPSWRSMLTRASSSRRGRWRKQLRDESDF